MRKYIEISEEKIKEFLEQFYGYFENGYIKVIENGYARQYALCKLDYIELGNR